MKQSLLKIGFQARWALSQPFENHYISGGHVRARFVLQTKNKGDHIDLMYSLI